MRATRTLLLTAPMLVALAACGQSSSSSSATSSSTATTSTTTTSSASAAPGSSSPTASSGGSETASAQASAPVVPASPAGSSSPQASGSASGTPTTVTARSGGFTVQMPAGFQKQATSDSQTELEMRSSTTDVLFGTAKQSLATAKREVNTQCDKMLKESGVKKVSTQVPALDGSAGTGCVLDVAGKGRATIGVTEHASKVYMYIYMGKGSAGADSVRDQLLSTFKWA